MTEVRIRPEEVGLTAAARILAFLNAVQTPAEIAEGVEIADEYDIGLGVARRILDARAELGGEFTSLQQVADVKYVGPERFTELVLALTGTPERPATTLYEELLAEVAALRAAVRALEVGGGPRYRVTLRSLAPHAYLGQPVTIIARVTSTTSGRPQVNLPLHFATTWGRLRARGQDHVELGSNVTARTGTDGTARVMLLPPTSETLTQVQQAALEAMLRLLDPEAGTPRAAEPGLAELSRHYDWATNVQFRRATDIYLHDFRPKLLDTLNRHDYMQVWRFFESLVVVYVQDKAPNDGASTPVEGSAVLNVRFKDWLGPFLQTYLQRVTRTNGLGTALTEVIQRGGAATHVLNGIYDQVNGWVGSRYGAIGQYVGRKLAADTLHQILDEGLADLSLDLRRNLAPALKRASNTVKASGTTILESLSQTQATVEQEVGAEIGQQMESVRTQLSALGTNVTALFDEMSLEPTIPLQILNPPSGVDPIIIGEYWGGGLFLPPIAPPIIPPIVEP